MKSEKSKILKSSDWAENRKEKDESSIKLANFIRYCSHWEIKVHGVGL